MVSIYVLGWQFNEEDLPHPRLAAGTTMLQSKPMRPLFYRHEYLTWNEAARKGFLVLRLSSRLFAGRANGIR